MLTAASTEMIPHVALLLPETPHTTPAAYAIVHASMSPP